MWMISKQTFDDVWRRTKAGEFDTNDIHTAMAAYVLGIPSKQVTPEQRQEAKISNYVHLYSLPMKITSAS